MNILKQQKTLVKYLIVGFIFTVLFPIVFWLLYPFGSFLAVVGTDLIIHILRYLAHRNFIFKRRDNYLVNGFTYLMTVAPMTILRFILVNILSSKLDRSIITAILTIVSVIGGYLVSSLVYKINFLKRIKD